MSIRKIAEKLSLKRALDRLNGPWVSIRQMIDIEEAKRLVDKWRPGMLLGAPPECVHEYHYVDAGPWSDDIFYRICRKCGQSAPEAA